MPIMQEQKIWAVRSHREALEFIEEVTDKADEYQSKVLAEILSRNANTEYLQRYCLNGRTDHKSFKKCVPIISYEDIQHDIMRIAHGDKSPILSATPISEFLTRFMVTLKPYFLNPEPVPHVNSGALASSGTSAGERKLMPTIPEELDRKEQFYSLLMPLMKQYMKGLERGKAMYFLFVKAETITPGGLPARPVLTSYYKSKHFQKNAFHQNEYTSPLEAILCTDTAQSMYVQMLCGLLQRHSVMRVGAVFASGLLRALHFLQKNWRSLTQDIRSGTLNPDAVSDPELRRAVEKVLGPDADLADLIHAECSDGEGRSWQGIIRRLWPNTRYLEVVVTGAMAQYIPALDFFSGGLPKACVMYASSECFFGVNLQPLAEPQDVSYTLIPTMAFFEFIPIRRANNNDFDDFNENEKENEQQAEAVDLANVQVGQEYELLVTTYAGLCRYRVGDVLRVTGFHNAAPQFKFICRRNAMLSIDADKTDEAELQEAVTKAGKRLLRDYGTELVEFSSYADTVSTIPGHYVLFWEVTPMPLHVPAAVMNECCAAVEEGLNSVYRQCRASDQSIGPLEIRVVQRGTFDEIMDLCIARGSSINQYKTPRCIRCDYILQLLCKRTDLSFFSPRPPLWTPRNDWHTM